MSDVVVLAYSGGLDTSVILTWLRQERGLEVVCFTADIGQGEELESARTRALSLGARDVVVEDLQERFVTEFVFPMFRGGAMYEGVYLLGTAIARPLIAERLVALAAEHGATSISHGATGKGNDQIRFELSAYGLNPAIKVIAPWREWDLASRSDLLAYAKRYDIEIENKHTGVAPYSIDANLLHVSYEGGMLEDPWVKPDASMWLRTASLQDANPEPDEIVISFDAGDPVAIDGVRLAGAPLLSELNRRAGACGIGRVDMVENRLIGMKSRGCYETPGGTVLFYARRALESITLDREEMHLRDDLAPRYSRLVYNALWFSPERLMLQRMIDQCQQKVCGDVRLELCRGSVMVTGRRSQKSLYQPQLSSFEDDGGSYNQADAAGFIQLLSLRLKAFFSVQK